MRLFKRSLYALLGHEYVQTTLTPGKSVAENFAAVKCSRCNRALISVGQTAHMKVEQREVSAKEENEKKRKEKGLGSVYSGGISAKIVE